MGWTSLINKDVSEEPKLAPKNYRDLEPFTINGEAHSGAGSGIPLREVSFYTEPWQAEYKEECDACSSKNTKCIYADFQNDMAGKSDNYELLCLDCEKFTQYHYMD